MQKFEELLNAARRLPPGERRKLIAALEAEQSSSRSEHDSDAATKRWLEMAGAAHSTLDDVSTNKNEHLADIYATKL